MIKLHIPIDLIDQYKIKNPNIDYVPIVSTQDKFVPVTGKSINNGDIVALTSDDADAETFKVIRKGYSVHTNLEGQKWQGAYYNIRGAESHQTISLSHPLATVWKLKC